MIKEIPGSQNILIIVHWITASQENCKMCKFTIAIIMFSPAILCEEGFLSDCLINNHLDLQTVELSGHWIKATAPQAIMYNVITISLCMRSAAMFYKSNYQLNHRGPVNIILSKVKIEMTLCMCFLQSDGYITTCSIISYQTQKNYNLN